MKLPQLRIMVVDDDADIRQSLNNYLADRGHDVTLADNAERALDQLQAQAVDVVITDVRMTGMDGFELLAHIQRTDPSIDVVVVTAFGDVESAVRAMREGAFDFFTKPFKVQDISAALQRTARFQQLRRENERYRTRLQLAATAGRQASGINSLIGASTAMEHVRSQILQVGKTPSTTVLILGETGTGKELVAQALHFASERAEAPFVAVDCSAIPAALMESQFFGHERGAFTDAQRARPGYFEQADGGTLFLDEIGDMSLDLQSRLLRTLESRQVRRVGAERTQPVDARVVAATHRDLAESVRQGHFREDLYYRVESFIIEIPPLRCRADDIRPLAEHFVRRYAKELRKQVNGLSATAIERLQSHDFPGNVRELRNIIERSVILCEGAVVDEAHLSLQSRLVASSHSGLDDPLSLDVAEERVIRRALDQADGHRGEAARLLGISRDALRRRLQRLGIDDVG